MEFEFALKNKKDLEKLIGLVFFDNEDNPEKPLKIESRDFDDDCLEFSYTSRYDGYDYSGCDYDAEKACETIKKKVGKNARVMYASELDCSTGGVIYIWSDFGEEEVHQGRGFGEAYMGDMEPEEWISEVKELTEEILKGP